MSTYLDDFSGGAATLNGRTFSGGGATWAITLGSALATDGSGHCVIPSAGGDNTAVGSGEAASDNVFAELDFGGFTGAVSWYLWFSCGGNSGGTSGYEVGFGHDGTVVLYAVAGGTYSNIGSTTWTPGAAVLRVERVIATNTVNVYINGGSPVISVVDSSEPTGSGNRHSDMGGYTNTGATLTINEFEYGDISSSGSVTGTGALTSPSSTIAGSGVRGHEGAGALTSPSSQVAGSGTTGGAGVTGTGALTSPSSQVAGAGKRGISDAGGLVELTSPASTISGAAVRGVSGSGALTSPSSAVAGAGVISGIAGLGALTSPSSQVAGVGVRRVFGIGALTSPSSQIAGISIRRITGDGSLTSPSSQASGSGTVDTAVNITGTGALVSPTSAIAGAGFKTQNITGTGALTSPTTRVIGTSYQSTGGGGGEGKNTVVIGIGIW